MDVNIDTVIESVAGDAPNARSWKVFADAINSAWRKSAGDFIECGRILAEAKEELSRDAFAVMVKSNKLDFDSSVGRKLMLIAANPTLCAPGHKLPPNWTILYELSKRPENILQVALADGRVHPGMSRADAIALNPSKKTTTKARASASANPTELGAVWQAASQSQRQAFLDHLGREGLCAVMSPALMSGLRDHIVNVTIAGASKSSTFAIYATDKLHTALRCAEEPNDENTKTMMAALGCIVKRAAGKVIARSDVVIAEGKSKGRK